jgi:hypothetical protein
MRHAVTATVEKTTAAKAVDFMLLFSSIFSYSTIVV